MDLRQLQYFLACAEKGSLTRAAEELYTSQPHVSQVIRSLERELGAALFRRTGTGIRLTEDGERILFYARNVLKNAELMREVCDEAGRGRLRIAANPSSRLAYFTGAFFRSAPQDVELRYTECGIEEMMGLLQERGYDMGFLFLPANRLPAFRHMAERRRLVYEPVRLSDLAVHCGPQSRFYGREWVEPEELDGCACIQLEDNFFSVEELLMEHESFRRGKCAVHTAVRTNSDHLMLRMLRETELCNIGSYWLRDAGDLSMAAVRGFEDQVSFGCLRPAGVSLRPEAERFLESMRDLIR